MPATFQISEYGAYSKDNLNEIVCIVPRFAETLGLEILCNYSYSINTTHTLLYMYKINFKIEARRWTQHLENSNVISIFVFK